jgi:hypothetical protein
MVGDRPEGRRGPSADGARPPQPLGRGRGQPLPVVEGDEIEQLGRLGDHRASSFHSMNLVGSKFIERRPVLSSMLRKIAVLSR